MATVAWISPRLSKLTTSIPAYSDTDMALVALPENDSLNRTALRGLAVHILPSVLYGDPNKLGGRCPSPSLGLCPAPRSRPTCSRVLVWLGCRRRVGSLLSRPVRHAACLVTPKTAALPVCSAGGSVRPPVPAGAALVVQNLSGVTWLRLVRLGLLFHSASQGVWVLNLFDF